MFPYISVLGLVLFQTGLFYLLPSHVPTTQKRKAIQVKNDLFSTFHALFMVCCVLVFLYRYPLDLYDLEVTYMGTREHIGDEFMSHALQFSISYFITDSFTMILYKDLFSVSLIFHHIIILSAVIMTVVSKVAMRIIFVLFFEECSTLFLNMMYLSTSYPSLNNVSQILFAVTFFLVRIVLGTCYLFPITLYHFVQATTITSYDNTVLFISMIVFFLSRCLNIYWFILIVKKIIKSLSPKENK